MACPAQVQVLHPEHAAVGVRMQVVVGEAGDLAFDKREVCCGCHRDDVALDLHAFPFGLPAMS
jgi:hypothetical protein